MSVFWHTNLFPTFTSMQDKRTNTFLRLCLFQPLVCACLTISVGLLCFLKFGEDLNQNALLNLSQMSNKSLAIAVQIMFVMFLASSNVFNFMPFKQAFIVIIDETWN